jgi:hypothetical protein
MNRVTSHPGQLVIEGSLYYLCTFIPLVVNVVALTLHRAAFDTSRSY